MEKVKLTIKDIRKRFRIWRGLKLEIVIDDDVVIKYHVELEEK